MCAVVSRRPRRYVYAGRSGGELAAKSESESETAFGPGAGKRQSGAGSPVRTSRVRWHVLTLVLLATGLTYLDRVNLSIAGHYIQTELHFGTETMGWIFSAFLHPSPRR